jgi:hypothetical protein
MAADVVFFVALGVMLVASFYYGPRIQADKVAMQWGLDGKPTWYAPKIVALWGLLGFAVLLRLFIAAAVKFIPDQVHHADIGLIIFPIIVAGVHIFLLARARTT